MEEQNRLVINSGNGVNYTTPRDAFLHGDANASRVLHDARKHHEEGHNSRGDYLKPVIFGGLDGILTSFAIVAGATGGHLATPVVLILGFSNIFADALSMGVGEYLSSKAHNEYVLSEKRREEWELKNHREGEIAEMIEIYVERGMSQPDAEEVVTKMSKYDEFFVNVMMVEELGLQVPDETEDTVKEGFIMFCAFAIFGSMPLLGYAIVPAVFPALVEAEDSSLLFVVACLVTAVALFVMGAVKSLFACRPWYCSGMETLALGGLCALVAYEIGQFVETMT